MSRARSGPKFLTEVFDVSFFVLPVGFPARNTLGTPKAAIHEYFTHHLRAIGIPIAAKRYVSSPDVSFNVGINDQLTDDIDHPFFGADDPTLPISDDVNRRPDQRRSGHTRLFVSGEEIDPHDPALCSLPRGQNPSQYRRIVFIDAMGMKNTKYVRISSTNCVTGETVFSSGVDLSGLSDIVINE